jgi:uncharacterized protein (DUF488 family)
MLSTKKKQVLDLLAQTGDVSRIRFVKLMFLVSCKEHSYDFVPYRYGPFSFELYHDLEKLSEEGMISFNDDKIRPIKVQPKLINVWPVLEEYFDYSDQKLIKYIYEKYPFYTVNSEIEKRMVIDRNTTGIYTIGYEGRSIDNFISTLVKNGISTLIDVRNNPFSRKYGFSRSSLMSICQKLDIEYLHIPELGITSEIRKNTEFDDWKGMLDRYEISLRSKNDLIKKIIELGQDKKVAMMCFEKDISQCHRGRLASIISHKGITCDEI